MLPTACVRRLDIALILGSLAGGVAGFLGVCVLLRTDLPVHGHYATLGAFILVLIIISLSWVVLTRRHVGALQSAVGVSALTAVLVAMVFSSVYELTAYLRLPVDLLSFAESPFVNDIIKLRLGAPLYTPPRDNNSYPYTPGTQVLTYVIAMALGHASSIPFYRFVQFSYVILASLVATSVCDLLARSLLSEVEYRYRPLWIVAWSSSLFLIAVDPRFNLYNHSLHNDGLALLVSVCAYWVIVKHSIVPRPWLLGLMAVLPTLGFMVKQSLLVWFAILMFYLLVAGDISWRQFGLFVFGNLISVSAAVGIAYHLWRYPFVYWIFLALGQKQVSLLRDVLNLLDAGIYAIMGILGGWLLVLRNGLGKPRILWVCWLLLFGTEVYTSGFAFQRNHLGPGVVIGACWFLVALAKMWPRAENVLGWSRRLTQEAVAVSTVVLLFGSMGLVREPRNPVPPDFFRYVAEIEGEFDGFSPHEVLMDTGTWVYLEHGVVMKDRSAPVSIHVGKNQPEVSHGALTATISRIEGRTYKKILARQLDTGESWYDFQDRGSGVKAAILANYHEVRRIPGVQGVDHWWPKHLLAEILVLVPNEETAIPSVLLGPECTGQSDITCRPAVCSISFRSRPWADGCGLDHGIGPTVPWRYGLRSYMCDNQMHS